MKAKKTIFSEFLLEKKALTPEQLQAAQKEQKSSGKKLTDVLVELELVEEKELLHLLSEHLEIPIFELAHYELDSNVSLHLPEAMARRFHVILLEMHDDYIRVGMVDPGDLFAIDEVTRLFEKRVEPVLVSNIELSRSLDLLYRKTAAIHDFAGKLNIELTGGHGKKESKLLEDADTSIVKLLNSLFEDAMQIGASDIHIEPTDKILRVRMRVDGFLQEHEFKEKDVAPALSRLLKLMAGLNIAETRLPQDGRFDIEVRGNPFDVRLSIVPIQFGESIVMRLLKKDEEILTLESLGMPKDILERIRHYIHLPNGIVLVTGPTGSGKTTTLYSALKEINDSTKNIFTIEDPIEYRLDRANQVQINAELGLTFARVLRSALRQDPNVILVGEIRDKETASIALRAALTGHVVFSTLHTNDAVGAAVRLIDIGVESYLVAATVRCVLSQRLVRRVCKSCAEPYVPKAAELEGLVEDPTAFIAKAKCKRGAGCSYCNQSGFKGRIGVFELLEFDYKMLDELRKDNTQGFVDAVRDNEERKTLLQQALALVEKGVTTIDEVVRISGDIGV